MKKKIVNIIGICFGVFLFFWGAMAMGIASDPISAIFMIPFALALGAVAGFIFADIAGSTFGTLLGKSIFLCSGNIKAPPPEFPLIRAKIANGKYGEAENDLRDLLAKDNGNPHIVKLLAELFIDKTGERHKAEGLLKAYLSKEERTENDLKFVMMLADIYIDSSKRDLALSMLNSEKSKNYDKSSLKSISNRISAIKQ